jgi:hypothetical protein
MVMKPGPVGFAQYIRSPSGNVKYFRTLAAASAAADRKNAESKPSPAPTGEPS